MRIVRLLAGKVCPYGGGRGRGMSSGGGGRARAGVGRDNAEARPQVHMIACLNLGMAAEPTGTDVEWIRSASECMNIRMNQK